MNALNLKSAFVIGTRLQATTYEGLAESLRQMAGQPAAVTVDFSNTHTVTMRRHDAKFRQMTDAIDYFIPDGMPLIWCMNRAGMNLRDRVYGPAFMRKFLETAPAGSTHYLLGGSAECGARLREIFTQRNPSLKFVGGFHGRCGADGLLEGAAEQEVIREINWLAPDFIWVGFGTPKQQAWTRRHKHRLARGVILTVGFAFDVNAGVKPDAPDWMQRFGLTWVFRLCSEPRRLAWRYFKYNSLFLFYLLADALRGRAFSAPAKESALE